MALDFLFKFNPVHGNSRVIRPDPTPISPTSLRTHVQLAKTRQLNPTVSNLKIEKTASSIAEGWKLRWLCFLLSKPFLLLQPGVLPFTARRWRGPREYHSLSGVTI